MTGFRHLERGALPRFSESIIVRTYPSGERRVTRDPPKELLMRAFEELGTRHAVALAFGVDRNTVQRWERGFSLRFESRPEAALASAMKRRITNEGVKSQVAQWLMDEGSVSVAYFRRGDSTLLLVCGSMNDFGVLSQITRILDSPITSAKVPGPHTLPMGAVRVQSARAYALLEVISPHLVGLKGMEAKAALAFFPQSGMIRGRHTTEEFLLPVWKTFAVDSLSSWNARRRVKASENELMVRAERWVEGRIRRARRFVDRQASSIPSALVKSRGSQLNL